ncbi:hypothetical protein ASPWEDRAFT_278722 [Aspergillus wentii DTO 134E9]|uniref:MARVEL domain-containing protein n=1 Tax=Aspergillus wentii DTO 134E9 TaxID=1073089 RepID=A0A1L9S3A0_ASPWE|nr:uncharacterized protein ASPWEDRAFT_278722 [Aspergillus wentii DTO 134E9]KAI9929991.1 hypothetical protein MW887_011801 [Aspergillus wentii]OJJ41646.1 hypothetical protein ASPWEDRAFT_278722 [Aspergillus wentii DTO 134E9]
MWFLVLRIFKLGLSQAKKHKTNKNQANQQPQPQPEPESNMRLPSSYFTSSNARNPLKTLLETLFRFFQFILGLTIIGLYAQDIHTGSDAPSPDAKWVYAVVTAFLATLSALVYLILPFILKDRPLATRKVTHLPLFLWECVLCILLLTLFGLFGKMYIGEHEGGSQTTRMRHAVWVDLITLVLWVGTGFWAGLRWWRGEQDGKDEETKEVDAEKGDA